MTQDPTRQKEFIITSLQTWDISIGTTIKNTALEISKQHRVLYVNTPLDYNTRLHNEPTQENKRRLEVLRRQTDPVRQINPNLWVLDFPFIIPSINRLPFAGLFNYFNYRSNRKMANYIRKTTEQLGFRHPILFIDNDIYRSFYLKELLQPALSIYFRRDNVLTKPYWQKHGSRLEPELIRKSDLVLTNSPFFAKELQPIKPQTYNIGAGVNLDLYDPEREYTIPEDIASIPYPIIGYTGLLSTRRLDEELLYQMAGRRPDYHFVFIGPEDEAFAAHPLHQLPNVHFTGKKRVEELPAYITAFDVCLNPQKNNTITQGNYPLKIDEYIAMGKPVVATRTQTMTDIFDHYVYLAEGPEEYLQQLDKALAEAGDSTLRTERIAFAQTHSWTACIDRIYEHLASYNL